MSVRRMGLLLLGCALWSCAGDEPKGGDEAPEPQPTEPTETVKEKPWEIVSNKGETYLPNVFYADASENEQIMPYAIDGHVMIDRLVYPTLGNPNLYAKADPKEELVTVLRVEADNFASRDDFAFFLVPRAERDAGKGIRIVPREMRVSPEPADMPAILKRRKTLRFVFDQAGMANVPAGLYDLRFELRDIREAQYNAVRVFDTEPDEYDVVNVTDTQVSVGDLYDGKTLTKLDEFVKFITTTTDPAVRNASFITFNGDLHNGGSPGSLRQRTVASTYNEEAKVIVNALKRLPLPIFLTTGNHDGYVSTGHVPSAVKKAEKLISESLDEVVSEAKPKAWPDFALPSFDDYLQQTEQPDRIGGIHRDVFTGRFARSVNDGFAGWKEIPTADRNYVVYDGFYQWQKTYGPLYYSHKFGKNRYVSLNSFELRQHRRSGWGMYTVNYGGGMSDVQMEWLDRELLRGAADASDVILVAHHDPRGGHKGKDRGYYFEQIDYRSMHESSINYLMGKAWNPAVCKLPSWALSGEQSDDCVHDGLQEWMRPDPEFDSKSSAIELIKRLAETASVRTLLLGHTHYNELEILQKGDELVPAKLAVDAQSIQRYATVEVVNPVRGYAESGATTDDYDEKTLPITPIERSLVAFADQYEKAIQASKRIVSSNGDAPRELAVLRFVSNADLANQTYSGGKSALGFAVLHLSKKSDARGVAAAQINRATFFVNVGDGRFSTVGEIDIDRTKKLAPRDPDNPLEKLYDP
jgi:hypothetical protein